MTRIDLDHAATTPVAAQVLEEMLPYLTTTQGNPSSVHHAGRAARAAVDAARDRLAAVLRCAQREIVFTGSGTEADNLAIRGVLERWGSERGRHIVVGAIEHEAVLETARRLEETGAATLSIAACDHDGRVSPATIAAAIGPDTVLVSVMLVNNETGVIQDVAALADAVRGRNPATLVHTDAVQALGRVPVDPGALGVDLLSLSAHKVYGPKGVGALWVRHGVAVAAQSTGGGQERNRRSATENVAGIVGFAGAAALAEERRDSEAERQTALCRRLVAAVTARIPDAILTGSGAPAAPGFATFAFAGVRSDVLLAALDMAGVDASAGSACASGAPLPSHVLRAMGYPDDLAAGALRCTTGRASTEAEMDRAGASIADAVERIRERRGVDAAARVG
ncbi:MAG: cysteine desulfurase [Chloroflexota bacterium]|jgi:cysteine desulfurase|nr:cysteine desulfurase [Chloroflexota bacterium]